MFKWANKMPSFLVDWERSVEQEEHEKQWKLSLLHENISYSLCVQTFLPFGGWSKIQSMRRYEVCLTNKLYISLKKKVLLTLRTLLFMISHFWCVPLAIVYGFQHFQLCFSGGCSSAMEKICTGLKLTIQGTSQEINVLSQIKLLRNRIFRKYFYS